MCLDEMVTEQRLTRFPREQTHSPGWGEGNHRGGEGTMNSSGRRLPPALCQTLHHTQTLISSSQEMGMVGVISQTRELRLGGVSGLACGVGWGWGTRIHAQAA